MSDSDRPSAAEILLGFDPDALEAAVTAELVKSKLTGTDPDWSMLGAILGVDPDWIESEYGPGFELAVEIDPELEAKIVAECGLEGLNSKGSGERN